VGELVVDTVEVVDKAAQAARAFVGLVVLERAADACGQFIQLGIVRRRAAAAGGG